MERHQVVPDVIDIAPTEIIQVHYRVEIYNWIYINFKFRLKVAFENATVDLGNELTPTVVKDQPSISYSADSDAYYTLCMTGT